ncbi:MAG TPA: hypothetical protein VFQ96_01340 [Microbacteriaceae bacterium]|nr:hypothetical protein [Microbacteriaceae bacterium]
MSVRASHARAFLRSAELVDQLGEDAGILGAGNVIGSLAVLAGIAAVDAVCGAVLGERAAGQDHAEAIRLLAATHSGKAAVPPFRRLMDAKTETQYSSGMLTDSRSATLLRSAAKIVAVMEGVLRLAQP